MALRISEFLYLLTWATNVRLKGGAENAGMENEGVECSLDETYKASPATTSEWSESPATAAAATDDCCEVSGTTRGFRIRTVWTRSLLICQSCALRVADLHSCCLSSLSCAYTRGDARFLFMTLCTHDVIAKILCRLCTVV